jgi:hypothetical protein
VAFDARTSLVADVAGLGTRNLASSSGVDVQCSGWDKLFSWAPRVATTKFDKKLPKITACHCTVARQKFLPQCCVLWTALCQNHIGE